MTEHERTYYECNACRKQHTTETGLIWISEIALLKGPLEPYNPGKYLHFCNANCLSVWAQKNCGVKE